jgi:hypothetical protein
MDYKLSLCFFFPYQQDSGVPVLFYRLANKISECYPNIIIYVIDYENGAMARNLKKSKFIKLLKFEDGVSITPPKESILIMQSILPYSMRSELVIDPSTKILFWNLHPDCLVPVLIPLPYLRNIQKRSFKFYKFLSKTLFRSLLFSLRGFFNTAIEKKSILFMDQPNLDNTRKHLFLKDLEVNFVQVPALKSNYNIVKVLNQYQILNFTWIGRLCDFKSYILIYCIKKMSLLSSKLKLKIQYSVIGDGPFLKKIQELNVNHDFFNLELLGALKTNELGNYLENNTDILTAMGTSALEGAKLGIPTILLDYSYFSIVGDYKFRWLHDTKNFDLAHEISDSDIKEGNQTLNYIFEEILRDYDNLSKKSYNYFINNHELELVMHKFISKVRTSEMRFSDINKNLLKKNIIRKTYDFYKLYI